MNDPRSADVPLFVRLPAEESSRLDRAAAASGTSKRRLVSDAVREHLTDEGLVVGRITLPEAAPAVLTPAEAAVLLKVDEEALIAAAETGALPGRRIGAVWRFSRPALLAWLGESEAPAPG
jgi:excisionase family DNA binding protein